MAGQEERGLHAGSDPDGEPGKPTGLPADGWIGLDGEKLASPLQG